MAVSLASKSTSVMASGMDSDVTKLKGTKITVTVEDALIDVLVVSFHVGCKIFQGALLDVSKKDAPYGIVPPSPPKGEEGENTVVDGQDEKTDKLHSLKQRHTYYQVPAGTTHFFISRYARNARDKSVRMRRLRPRKILCSHCKEIFNDDPNQKRGVVTRNKNLQQKPISGTEVPESHQKPRVLTRSTRSESTDKKALIGDASQDSKSILTVKTESKPTGEQNCDSNCSNSSSNCSNSKSDELNFQIPRNQRADKMVLRKRKLSFPDNLHVLSSSTDKQQKRMDAVKCESSDAGLHSGSAIPSKSNLAKTSPVIKISFANPQGKDTVLKIPARVQMTSDTEEELNWSHQENSDLEKSASAKAAKKALKKAKKEAQKKATTVVYSQNQENGNSPFPSTEDRHHHHRHKVKKKRRHKSDDEADKYNSENTDTRNVFNTMASGGNEGWCLRANYPGDLPLAPSELNTNKQGSVFDDVKNKCLHQKLSISLKRLNAKAYMRCSPKYSVEEDSTISDNISDASTGSVGSGEGSDYGDVPDFPKHSSPLRDMDKVKPLMMRISTHNVKKCLLDIGREMTVGDIVWGKIHGFPWWPGKVLALTVSQRDNGSTINQQAHVSWFGSPTSSYMPCNQLTPFLDDFKIRYNKKKRGPYKEAIRQAWHEANVVNPPPKDIHELNIVTT